MACAPGQLPLPDPPRTRLGLLAFGFFALQLVQELCVESVFTRIKDVPAGIAVFLTLFQNIGCILVPVIATWHREGHTAVSKMWSAPQSGRGWGVEAARAWSPYVLLAGLVFCSTGVANMAVQYVDYPVKVVFKSAKLIPTMLLSGVFGLSKKPFGYLEYTAAAMLCGGAAGFAFGSGSHGAASVVPAEAEAARRYSAVAVGCAMLLMAISADAFVPNVQQTLMQGADGLSAETLMLRTNAVGTLFICAYQLFDGTLIPAVLQTMNSPVLLLHLVVVGSSLGGAVLCYTLMIDAVGGVFAVRVSTLRKVVTVLLSYIVFPKPWGSTQVLSLLLVFGGLSLHAHAKSKQ